MGWLPFHLLLFYLWPPPASLLADGFFAGGRTSSRTQPHPARTHGGAHRRPPPWRARGRRRGWDATLALLSSAEDDDGIERRRSPATTRPPEHDVVSSTALLSRAYQTMTVKELRDVLRRNGAKVSGNKRQLVDRLEEQMNKKKKSPQGSPTLTLSDWSLESANSCKCDPMDSYNYNNTTVKELKDLLRRRGAKVSGNKRELVHRLMSLQNENNSQPKSKSQIKYETESWYMLEPSVSNATSGELAERKSGDGDDTELPFLNGLIFVNKPSGWSTLPTKQQVDNPDCPEYPCLSESVNDWLNNHPEGQRRAMRALEEEDKWWDFILELPSITQNSKLQKKWKRKRKKMDTKKSAFEPRPVHRLDIDTSGIVCIALTPYALRAANKMFETKSRRSTGGDTSAETINHGGQIMMEGVEKRYVALVEGALSPSRGTIEHSIGQVWVDDHHEWACDISGNGTVALIRPDVISQFVPGTLREALTSYTSIESEEGDDDVTRVELKPHTGRGHQLRLHMVARGYPIAGDDMHGVGGDHLKSATATSLNGGRLCLHASRLSMDVWSSSSDSTGGGEFRTCRICVESRSPF